MRLNLMPAKLAEGIAAPIGRTVGAAGITPNMVSMAGFLGNVLAAYLVTREALLAAGIAYLIFSALDLVDGAVARATGQASAFGAVFDAVLDRSGEMVLLAACAWYFAERGEELQAGAAFAAAFGSVAVSYMRARAEVVGLTGRDGLFRRQERVLVIGLGLCLNGLALAIWALAILANLTALQRFWIILRALRAEDARGAE